MFDCVATRLRIGREFGFELQAVQDALGPQTIYADCNSYGQIARAEGRPRSMRRAAVALARPVLLVR